MRLAEADDPVRNTSAVRVVENGLLTNQLADNQQLLVNMASGGQKVATTGDQGVNAREVSLQVAELLLDGFADLADPGPLLFGHCKKLLPRPFAVRTRLVAKAVPHLNMHRINQDLSCLPGFIEQG